MPVRKQTLSNHYCSACRARAPNPCRVCCTRRAVDPAAAHADIWVVDAGRELSDSLAMQPGFFTAASSPVLLSNGRLDAYRQNFSHEMNTMRKDLADADAVFDRLRKVDVSPWCPPEVAGDPAVREFVRSLYLSGNGAVIFGNSFVEWASSEAFRRARPSFLAARFGVRTRPKPFTGVAVFDNPDQVNPLPAVDDFEGSAVDAQMLALYVWLAATRFEEYQRLHRLRVHRRKSVAGLRRRAGRLHFVAEHRANYSGPFGKGAFRLDDVNKLSWSFRHAFCNRARLQSCRKCNQVNEGFCP